MQADAGCGYVKVVNGRLQKITFLSAVVSIFAIGIGKLLSGLKDKE